MQRTITSLVPRRHLRSALLHLPRPCTCPSIPVASRTFMNYAAPRNSGTSESSSSSSSSSSTSSTSSTSPSPPPESESESELSMEEKLARHRARVAAGRAKRHAELEAQAAAEAAGLPWPPEGETTSSSSSTTSTSSTDSTSSTTSETASTESKPLPPRSSFDIRKFIRSEIHNIRQHVKKFVEPSKATPPVTTTTETKIDQKEKVEEEEEPVSDGKFYAPMTQESDETVWEQRIHLWSERTRTVFSAPFRTVRRTVKTSDNVVMKKIGEAHVKVSDRVEEFQDNLDTTQNPTVWKIRDAVERISREKTTAVAHRELEGQLPGFDSTQFMRDVHGMYVPMILRWMEQRDMPSLRTIVEKETPASSFLISWFKGREEDDKKYIINFVGLGQISMARLMVVNEQPWVVVTFSVGTTMIPRTPSNSKPTTGSQPLSSSLSSSSSSSPRASSSSLSSSSSSSSSSFIIPPSKNADERERYNFTLALCPDTRPENPFGWRLAEISASQVYKIGAGTNKKDKQQEKQEKN